ncbi:hypothetical protein Bhyg_10446 [Pseudolycoriella hygida]|uniref:Uncharacterized protein n=1 Tax=Pseudolycoriella hygida TaxID=35572 RepID=A0A9Q0MV26_9DIPT|nr:hypothetical protein Bhyg_10446 [Pseudolycoriella hygida]
MFKTNFYYRYDDLLSTCSFGFDNRKTIPGKHNIHFSLSFIYEQNKEMITDGAMPKLFLYQNSLTFFLNKS